MKDLIIIGTGGNAFDILDIVDAINAVTPTWHVGGFVDDARPVGSRHLGIPILGKLADVERFAGCRFINAIASDRSFRQVPDLIGEMGLKPDQFATLIHPKASISGRARLGAGTYADFGVSVAGNVSIGDHVMLGTGCIVGHDAVIEDHTAIAPGAIVSGAVHIERNCYIGAGSMIRQRVRVGECALVGMGAVVVRDVSAGCTVVGNPAKVLSVCFG